ncbi:conserved hypothetical protein [Burkholderia multivorans CGD1]|nr:conserved hypothetical protein [Burkholderia multivorans CGD1]
MSSQHARLPNDGVFSDAATPQSRPAVHLPDSVTTCTKHANASRAHCIGPAERGAGSNPRPARSR